MKITTARSLRAPNTLESSSDADVDCLRKNNLHLRVLHAFRLLILILCLQRSIVCHALDVDPGDYTPMPMAHSSDYFIYSTQNAMIITCAAIS